MNKVISTIVLLFLLSCSSDKTDVGKLQTVGTDIGTGTPQADSSVTSASHSLEIAPLNATKASRLYVVPHGFDLSGAKIEWLVNGMPAPNPRSSEFDASTAKKGDSVQARAVIDGKELVSNVVQIRNSPPEISRVKIVPEVLKPGDFLGVDAAGTDIDGDDVTLSYQWTKNGESAGEGWQLRTHLKRGDKISVTITPFDGTDYGRAGTIKREIVNMPPTISDDRKYLFDGKRYSQQVHATDPDGDDLAFSLRNAPAGMKIDPSSGDITWDVPNEFIGKASFTIVVNDGHGGEATQLFTLEIKQEQKE